MGDKGVKVLARLERKAMKVAPMVRFGLIDTSRSLQYTIAALMYNPMYREVQAVSIPATLPYDYGSQVRAQDRGRQLCHTFSIERYLDGPVCVHDRDLDVLFIKGPPIYRHTLMNEAITAGKHIICTPPTTANDLVALIYQQQRQYDAGVRRLCFMAQPYRFLTMVKKCRDLVANGELGTVKSVDMQFSSAWGTLPLATNHYSWWHRRAQGGGVVNSYGYECIDTIAYVLNQSVTSARATFACGNDTVDSRKVTTEDVASIELRMASDEFPNCTLQINGLEKQWSNIKRQLRIEGTKSTALLDFVNCELYVDGQLDHHEELFSSYAPTHQAGAASTSYGLSKLFNTVVKDLPKRGQNMDTAGNADEYTQLSDALPIVATMDAVKVSGDGGDNQWTDVLIPEYTSNDDTLEDNNDTTPPIEHR